jgi:hypothetical protein
MYAYVCVCVCGSCLLGSAMLDVGDGGYVVWIRRCVDGQRERPYCSFFLLSRIDIVCYDAHT